MLPIDGTHSLLIKIIQPAIIMKFYKEEEGFLLSEAKITGHVSLG